LKAVIPAAGLGTRFLPATKSMPKEMLPIIDTPSIQYVVEEAILSGIDDILIITGKGKRSIEDYFDKNFELEYILEKTGKYEELKKIKDISNLVDIQYIRQKEQKGLGDAIYSARKHIGNESFAVLLGDDIIKSKVPCTKQLIEVHEKYGSSVVALEEVPKEKVSKYGIIKGNKIDSSCYKIMTVVEKPNIKQAPSNLSIPGRYVLTPKIFDCIKETPIGKGKEIQLTDSLMLLLNHEDIYGVQFEGKRYDIGDKIGYIEAIIDFALEREEFKLIISNYIHSLAI